MTSYEWCWCGHELFTHEEMHDCLVELCPCEKFLNVKGVVESGWYLKEVKVSMK